MLKWLLVFAGVLAGLAVAAVAAIPWLLDTPAVQAQVAQAVSHALGRPVKLASLSVSLLPLPSVRLKDLRVADDPAFGTGPFVTVGEGKIRIRLRPLLSGRIELADLTLVGARIALIEDAAGRFNVTSLGVPAPASPGSPRGGVGRSGGASASPVLLSNIRVVDGYLQYQKLGSSHPALSLQQINATLRQSALREALSLSGDAIAEPGGIQLSTKDATLTPGGTRVLGDMALRATVEMEAKDVAPLAAAFAPSSGVSGPMKGKVEVTGSPGRLSATGAISAGRLTLSAERPACGGREPRRLEIEAVHVPLVASPTRIDSAPVEAKVARGALSFRASVVLDGAPALTLTDINVRGMDLGPVLVDYLCQPYAVTGPIDLTGEARVRRPDAGAADIMSGVDGAGRVKIGAGKVVGRAIVNLVRDVVGLSSAVSAVVRPGRAVSSPLDFDSITATYTVVNGVARTDDLVYRARDVRVAAAGTYGLSDGRVAMEVTLIEGANQVKGIVTGGPGSLRVVPTGVRVQDRDIKKFLDRIFR
jgi:AsmA protein